MPVSKIRPLSAKSDFTESVTLALTSQIQEINIIEDDFQKAIAVEDTWNEVPEKPETVSKGTNMDYEVLN